MLNAYHDPVTIVVPAAGQQRDWQVLVDAASVNSAESGKRLRPGQSIELRGQLLMLLKTIRHKPSRRGAQIGREAEGRTHAS
jgi:hypothetical protein